MRRLLFMTFLVFAACGEERVVLQPVIDLPDPTSDAYPLDAVESLELAVAESGSTDDIAVSTGTPDALPTLEDIPFDEDLVLHLSGEAAGVEIAYGRSCPFSVPADELQPHMYFSRAVKWASSADPGGASRTRFRGHGAAFGCGAVFFGGEDLDPQIELFDTMVGNFQTLQVLLLPRSDTVYAPLPGGRVLIVGGVDASNSRVNKVEVFNPGAALVEEDAGPAVTEHAAVVLDDGSVVVAGGRNASGVTGEAWRFDLDQAGGLDNPVILTDPMLVPRAGHTMTRLSGEFGAGVLIVGGRDDGDFPIATAELYRPLRDQFEPGAALSVPRYGHRAVRMLGGFVLIIGGFNPSPVRALEVYDPVTGTFESAGDLPGAAGITDMAVTRLPDDRVLLTGGRDEIGQLVSSAHIARVDPFDGRVIVVATDEMEVPRAGHSAVLLGDGTVLVVGGTDDDGARAERYNPPSEGRR